MSEHLIRTRDHHVPRMYLKRFSRVDTVGRDAGLVAVTTDLKTRFVTSVSEVAVERGFYWGTDVDGVPHHDLEEFLTSLESAADVAFRAILDTGNTGDDDALPPWPPPPTVRLSISWWMAAQILRTVRQRRRLDLAHDSGHATTPDDAPQFDMPRHFESANRHIRYIAEMVEGLAAAIFFRPWGVGFSDYCLLTSDVPVLVLNGQDHHDQGASVRYWDVFMPMDPHRCLYLPGLGSVDGGRILVDHRLKLHPGHALGLNSLVIDTAARHVFLHPDHDPTERARPAVASVGGLPQMLLNYEVLPPGHGVQRKWLTDHPEPAPPSAAPSTEEAILASIQRAMAEIDRRRERFERSTDPPHY